MSPVPKQGTITAALPTFMMMTEGSRISCMPGTGTAIRYMGRRQPSMTSHEAD